MDSVHGSNDIFGGGVARQIAANAGTDALEEAGVVAGHVDQQDQNAGPIGSYLANRGKVFVQVAFRGEQHDLGLLPQDRFLDRAG